MMMAAVALFATTAFAQEDLVKQAKKLCDKGELEQAATTLTPALTSDQTEDKAEAWNLMSDIQYQLYMKGQQAEIDNKQNNTSTPYDTTAMHKAMVASLEAALKCDEYDCAPNEKGKVKIRFREANGKKFALSRPYVISAGLFAYNHGNVDEAIKAWRLYIDSAESPLFTGIDMTKDPYRADVCYYIGLAAYNQVIGENGYRIINRNRPYDQEKNALVAGANVEPDVTAARRTRFIIFLILLIVPAINLSSMTQSRLRRRVAEIGVRRAFGCTRMELLGQILGENFIVTLLAGVLGLIISFLFAFLLGDTLFVQDWTTTLNPPVVDASILIHASTFGWALLFCFVLNLLSTGIPAWRASRMNIVEAINGKAQ